MSRSIRIFAIVFAAGLAAAAGGLYVMAAPQNEGGKLAVVWTSADPDVAHRMCLMYTHAAKTNGWFDEVRLVVWGPSQRLFAGDKDIQAKIKAMQDDGVIVEACIACANTYGLAERLRALGLEVKPMGQPLTQFLKTDYEVLSF